MTRSKFYEDFIHRLITIPFPGKKYSIKYAISTPFKLGKIINAIHIHKSFAVRYYSENTKTAEWI